MKNKYWVIPNLLFQADGTEGGDPPAPVDPPESDEVTLEPSQKLFELDLEIVDQLFDRDDIDGDKLLEWMKTRDEESTLESILIQDEDPGKAKEDPEKDPDETDDDEGKLGIDHKEEEPGEEDPGKKTEGKVDDKGDEKADKTGDPGKTEEPVVDGKTKTKAFKITEEYINKQVQNFRDQWKDDATDVREKKVAAVQDILNGIKGTEMDQKALKNYINAQIYIKTIKSPFDPDWKPDSKVTDDPEYIKEATKQKHKMIVDKMKKQYPEFPDDAFDDEDSLRDFEDSLSRREFLEYNKMFEAANNEIDGEYDRYVHITQNWEDIAEKTIKTDVALFTTRLARLNLTPKDLGIESLDLNQDDLYNEYLWKNILFKDGDTAKPNDAVLEFMDGVIPIVKPLAVYHRLMDLNVDAIVQAREHKARLDGFKSGQNNVDDPSTANLPGKEHRQKIEIEAEDFDNDDLTPEQMQEKLDALKTGIANASGASVKSRKR